MKASTVALIGMIALSASVRPLAAQLMLTASASPIIITPPDSTAYTSGLSATTAITVTLECDVNAGSNSGCEVDWSYTGTTFLLDYQVTSPTSNCASGTSTASLAPVPTGPLIKLAATNRKQQTCAFTLMLRVHNLSITTELSGVTYLQALTLKAFRQP